jgi:ATP-dependent Clp protease ATP-binding subunit ClpA
MSDEPKRRIGGELARFTRDLTAEARAGRLEPIRSRNAEISRVIDILLRHGKNNPVLTGAAGVGKTAIADGFAQRIAAGEVPLVLQDVALLSLDHVALLAGTTYRGQYEERIKTIVSETTANPDVILFIDEMHNLIGQGTAMGAAMDAANMLKPSLVRGDFRVIGATTDEEYDRWIGGDPALERRFHRVDVRELGVPETLDILRARKERLERHHNVVITDEAMEASVTLTDKYVMDRRRPDKALDALDEAAAHLQAVAKYPPRAATLIKERMKRLRPGRSNAKGSNGNGASADSEEPKEWRQMAKDGMSALERFGAELENMLTKVPAGAPAQPAQATQPKPAPAPPPPPPPEPTLGELETELARVLAAEGIVVRGHDIARVVGLTTGKTVVWDA